MIGSVRADHTIPGAASAPLAGSPPGWADGVMPPHSHAPTSRAIGSLTGPQADGRERRARAAWALQALICLGLPAGTLLVAYAYALAGAGDTGQVYYHLFWLGVLMVIVPAGLRLCGGAASRIERLALIAVDGVFNYLPKYLRTPGYLLFHDELAHWRQSELAFASGRLFLPNPTVYISQYFPGLQGMTVALRDLTGLSTFTLGAILIVCTSPPWWASSWSPRR
jgi:hypothetical protein